MNSIRKTLNKNQEQKKKDASISLHKPIRGNSHLSNNTFIKTKRIMKSLLVRRFILLNYKYNLFFAKWEAFP
ncbi:nicotinic acid mononucleotide adenyltransferase domain protein [Streptococcus pneumoniae GA11184]|nr:nicotinic acid mononucleotide adenyltransferase domain protein [Streptococcus pneumoniae GA11184]